MAPKYSVLIVGIIVLVGLSMGVHASTFDGGENGTPSSTGWGEYTGDGTGTIAYTTTRAYGGNKSILVNETTDGGYEVELSIDQYDNRTFEWYFYDDLNDSPTSSNTVMGMGSSNSGAVAYVQMGNTGGSSYSYYRFATSSGMVALSLRSRGWHKLQIYHPGGAQYTIFIDNVQVFSGDSGNSPPGAGRLFAVDSFIHLDTASHSEYFDNVAVYAGTPTADCLTNWTCGSYAACLPSNVSACLGMTDTNSCNLTFSGNVASHDQACVYVCVPSWSCSAYAACVPSNVSACSAVSDANLCGETFNGTLSDYDESCGYVAPPPPHTLQQSGFTIIILGFLLLALLLVVAGKFVEGETRTIIIWVGVSLVVLLLLAAFLIIL